MKSLLLPLPLLFFALAARAQLAVSPVASFDFGSPLFINRAPGVLNPFSATATATSSISESYGVGAEFLIPGLLAAPIGLMGRIAGVYTTGHFDASNFSVTGSEAKLLLEAGANWNLAQLSISAGPWISQAIVRNISETNTAGTNITPPDSASAATHAGLFAGIAWDLPDFSIRPEITTHIDLTPNLDAGSNAWSIGLSLTYSPRTRERRSIDTEIINGTASINPPSSVVPLPTLFPPKPTSVRPSVHFLVNGSEARGNPPLEREEVHVTEYTMVDAPNASPKVTQWIDKSYHLPHLSIMISSARGGSLEVWSADERLFSRLLPADSAEPIQAVNLDEDSSWPNGLVRLRSNDTNRLVAELRAGSSLARDTLVFPPADSASATSVIAKYESRFLLSGNYARYSGGGRVLELLLQRMQSLLVLNPKISISANPKAAAAPLMNRLRSALGNAWPSAHSSESSEGAYISVVFEY